MSIDASARIDPKAELDSDVTIGPWTIIGPDVQIGAGTVIDSHVVIRCNTRIGQNNRIFQFSSVGEDPADKKFAGEETWLEIGNDNTIREGANLHRGTGIGGGLTRIGNDNLLMPYVHIAHDCMVGNNIVFANNVGLSGHVEVDDWAILGGYSGVNQFLKIGAHSMIGGVTHVGNDVPAYVIVSGQPAAVRSINKIGLQRRGFDAETIKQLREAFKIIYLRGHSLKEAIVQVKVLAEGSDALQVLVRSLESSEKGIQR
ncbi:MAG: acyl-[acyl-carrier-protein]--UDP-N-acetylglucosamine O-acyltransferase [SAR86 cluster bacterium]|uniref:Acyl-[acyl-carrier-protein]--UDP-N-acetylglucosamine O-acyltransferase n=1 Tax=SAR86 cluster bacterium TaxID=2030880 RepID=A0A2A5AZN4_9GAMM|nr:MAG: acyl-[acyl-carrier-protein]--UDP-N-acetylglucosamine O-acyltransferase [SAR86 cluster bacterium]